MTISIKYYDTSEELYLLIRLAVVLGCSFSPADEQGKTMIFNSNGQLFSILRRRV